MQQWQGHQGIKKKHEQKPQMEAHPSKIPTESIPSVKIAREKLKKGTAELVIGESFDVNLRRYEDEYAKNERNEKPCEPFPQKFTSTPEIQGKA
jgi:hypothetical protein